MRKLNLLGQTFGRLTVISQAPSRNGHTRWNCICTCGSEVSVLSTGLRSGNTKSCGCLHSEISVRVNTVHGGKHTRLYASWAHMLQRCRNCKDAKFKDYGARGITVCDEWSEYAHFQKWALENGYRDDLTLDRIDVNGNYCPENCRWVSNKEQQRNKRNNRLLTFNGRTLCIADWAEEIGLPYSVLLLRIQRGWTTERALTTPLKTTKKK